MYDKNTRVLYMFQQLLQDNKLYKEEIRKLFQIDNRTFERDIATLRTFLSNRSQLSKSSYWH